MIRYSGPGVSRHCSQTLLYDTREKIFSTRTAHAVCVCARVRAALNPTSFERVKRSGVNTFELEKSYEPLLFRSFSLRGWHGKTGEKRLRPSHYRYRNENIDRTSEVQAFTSENPRVVRVINHRFDRPSPSRSPVLFHCVTRKCLTGRSVGE